MNEELKVIIEKLIQSLDVFGKISVSLERSLENIISMIIEKTKSEVEGLSELTDDEIKREMKEELDELKEHLRKNKIVVKKLAEIFKIDIEKESVEISNLKNLETIIRQNDVLIQDLVSEIVAELEVLQDEFKFARDEKGEKYVKMLVTLLEELTDRSFEVSAILETNFDWDLESEFDLDLIKETFEQEKENGLRRPEFDLDR
ncbi:hypothetical protein [Priestia koreensis]|uniref:hypothetical protein n=1 Tax=Priestia koreensis TaxID=284581 RepID=UPI00203D5591|nr:hypothetical protein [Priestia koreensis]MCM3005696.1 hypothetical protein [Priestia koreensis]